MPVPDFTALTQLPQYQQPQIPNLGGEPGGSPSYENIMKLLSQPRQSITQLALPPIAATLGQQSQFLQPQIAAIQERTGQNVASAQSEAMRRGLTGSDIEAAGMAGARTAGLQEEAGIRGQFGLQQAQTLAADIMQTLGFDLQANQGQLQALAQAMGQELSSRRSMEMFRLQLDAARSAARRAGNMQMFQSLTQIIGQVAGAAAGAYFGGPVGAAAAGTAGRAIGGGA